MMAEPDPKLEIVTIFESDDPVAFSLARSVLDEAGVEYGVVEEALAGFGFSPMLNPMRKILIPAYRKEQALELMDRIAGPEEAESGEAGGAADEDGS
jgi:hypothetical protein